MRKDKCVTADLSHCGVEPSLTTCDETGQARQSQAILYIDHHSLTRECVGQHLAMLLPESVVVTIARVEDIPKETGEARKFSVGILNKHAAPIAGHELADQLLHLADLAPSLPLVLVSAVDDADDVVKAFGLGVRGYIPLNLPIEQAVWAIRLVSAGGSYVPSSILSLSRNVAPSHTNRKEHHCAERFTPRQMEVLQHLWQGKQNKTIAYDLEMRESTVKVHIRDIMKELNARNRTQVVLRTHSLNENHSTPIEN